MPKYTMDSDIFYFNKRYGKTVHVPKGYPSDGATCAIDIDSLSWKVHDFFCDGGGWTDGTFPTELEIAIVLHDILSEEHHYIRCFLWPVATYSYRITKQLFKNLLQEKEEV